MNDALPVHCDVTVTQKWLVFCAMCAAIFIVAFATTATTNAMVPIRAQMHLNPAQLQWTTNAYILAALIFMILGGLLSDRFGRRNMNVIGGLIFVTGSIVCSMAGIGMTFIVGRFVQGLGVAIIMPGTLALMKVVFPPEQQGVASTGWAASSGMGMGLGPFFSGIFCETVGWQFLFRVIAIAMFFSVVLLIVAEHKRFPGNKKVTIDFWGFLIFLLGFGVFIYDFTEGLSLGWKNPLTIILFVVGLAFMFSQPWVERHVHKTPFINFSYFKRPRFALGCIGMFITGYSLISLLFFGNLYIQSPLLLNYSPYEAGLAVIPLGVGLTFSVLTVEKLYEKIGVAACIQFLFCILIVGHIWFVFLGIHTPYVFVWEPFFLVGVGCGMAIKAFPAMAIEALTSDEAARSSSVVNSCLYIGVIFATSIGTLLAVALTRRLFLEFVATLSHPLINIQAIAIAINSHAENIAQMLLADPGIMRHPLFNAAQMAALKGFQYAILGSVVFLVLGMIATNILLKMKEYEPPRS